VPTGVVTAAVGISAHLLGTTLATRWLRRKRPEQERTAQLSTYQPGVSILKPLCGVDENLEHNLESFARLTYPRYELILGASDASDPALTVARRVAARHPEVDISIVVCEPDPTCNPKVVNLEAMYARSQYELCMISDSNVLARPDELEHLAPEMEDPQVGLVYQPVIGVGEKSATAAIENFKLTEQGGYWMIYTKALTGIDAVMGKGMLLRREALDGIGGFNIVRRVAAEDYVLGIALKGAGWKLVMSMLPAQAVHTRWSLSGFMNRTFRHAAMRVRLSPLTYPMEILANPFFLTLLGCLTLGIHWLPMTLLSLFVKTSLELAMSVQLRGRWPHWYYLPLLPVKDILVGLIWLPAIFGRTVTWRGNTLRLGWGTRLTGLDFEPSTADEPLEPSHAPLPLETPHRRRATASSGRKD
jgi:ceramide glucosyltransferase